MKNYVYPCTGGLLLFFWVLSFPHASLARNHKNYLPISVGNKWEYTSTIHKDDSNIVRKYILNITNEIVDKNGNKEIFIKRELFQDGKLLKSDKDEQLYMIQTSSGMVSPETLLIYKFPLTQGAKWTSISEDSTRNFFEIENTLSTINVKGIEYGDCLVVKRTTDYQAFMLGGPYSTYLAYEFKQYLAPNIGVVLKETTKIHKDTGERTLVNRSELVSFSQNESLIEQHLKPPQKTQTLYKPKDSFRFPESSFHHPSISPGEKWLVYQHIEPMFGNRTLLYSKVKTEH